MCVNFAEAFFFAGKSRSESNEKLLYHHTTQNNYKHRSTAHRLTGHREDREGDTPVTALRGRARAPRAPCAVYTTV